MKVYKNRKLCLVMMMILSAMCLLSGCSSKSDKIDKDGNINFNFWSIFPEGDPNYEWMLSVIDRFEERNPNININYTGISFWDYFTKITTAMTDQAGPDIYLQTIKDTGDRARGGVSMNLTPFFDDTYNTGEEFFFSQDILPMTYKENVYGVPYSLDNRVLYYNIDIVNQLKDTTDTDWTNTKVGQKTGTTITGKPSDLLDENGNVRAPQTYDELLAYQELLTVYKSGKITQLGFDVNIGNFKIENLVFTHGGDFFDAEDNPMVSTNEGVKKGFETWYELTHTLSQAKVNAFVDTAGDNTTNLFWSGLVGIIVSTNEIPWQNDALGDSKINLGAAPVPYNNVEENRYNFSGGFSLELSNRLSKESEEVQKAAFEFVKFLTSEEIQKEVLTVTGNMPANKKVCDAFIRETEDPVKKVVFNEMDYRKPYQYIYDAPNWFGEVQNSLTDYVSDKRSLEETLERIQSAIVQLKETY
ncbi:extracellular solute-binding protein [Lachnoclostridium sp.]|uniref:extracellular solute-binding protein n=1 Tax=Lachnoclostridium sp. TaxID=2028282 RepID=UPI002897361E|nr:extracellular solute-binding protein [Lachnoclostridium sp.]